MKIARILFLIVGCIMPIFIGILHTITHFVDLVKPEIETYLQKEFSILGQDQTLWNSWGLVSFMMGASFVVIGLINLSVWKNARNRSIPTLPIIAMIVYQLCVVYVGYEFNAAFQLYGGMFGLAMIIICYVLNAKNENNAAA